MNKAKIYTEGNKPLNKKTVSLGFFESRFIIMHMNDLFSEEMFPRLATEPAKHFRFASR